MDLGFANGRPGVEALCEAPHRALSSRQPARRSSTGRYSSTTTSASTRRIEGVDKFVGIERDLWENRLDELDPLSASGWNTSARRRCRGKPRSEIDRRQLVADVAAIFDDVDLIVTPMSSMPPFAAEGPMPTEINGTEVHGGMAVVLAMSPTS